MRARLVTVTPSLANAGVLPWQEAVGWFCGDAACLVLDKVPVEAVELVQRHDVQELFDEGQREEVAAAVQQHPAPQEARRIHDLQALSREMDVQLRALAHNARSGAGPHALQFHDLGRDYSDQPSFWGWQLALYRESTQHDWLLRCSSNCWQQLQQALHAVEDARRRDSADDDAFAADCQLIAFLRQWLPLECRQLRR